MPSMSTSTFLDLFDPTNHTVKKVFCMLATYTGSDVDKGHLKAKDYPLYFVLFAVWYTFCTFRQMSV